MLPDNHPASRHNDDIVIVHHLLDGNHFARLLRCPNSYDALPTAMTDTILFCFTPLPVAILSSNENGGSGSLQGNGSDDTVFLS